MNFARRLNGLIARTVPVKIAALRGTRPVASITFDDFPKSAWTIGGAVLAHRGVRATYYTAGGFCGRTVNGTEFYDEDDLRVLHESGHEIGCHGFAHQPTPSLQTDALVDDADLNARFLRVFLKGADPVSYAFPFGAISLRTKRLFASRFANARGVHPGVNAGKADLADLRAISMECRSWDDGKIANAIGAAREKHGWVVFYTHEVCDNPSEYGTTPARLESVLQQLGAAGIEILPMREAQRVATGEVS